MLRTATLFSRTFCGNHWRSSTYNNREIEGEAMRTLLIVLVFVGGAIGGVTYYSTHVAADSVVSFRTVAVKRGDLQATIGATGTCEPEEVVDVGAQVAGLILEFGQDPRDPTKCIDYGSVVEKDTVLAKIDPTAYQASYDQADATLERSKADLLQLEAKYFQAEQEWKRAESLKAKNAIADTDFDTAMANVKAAKANLAVGNATIRQNEASLRMAKTNLGYTVIKSPVRGVILDRRVNIGQTVVASLNAPSLFLIAKDLRRMQVWASVNEADIGQIHVDLPVRFTVDAYPGETFRGRVTQVRMNATMTQNVVTYTVVVTTDNSSGKLLPYLTANVQFETQSRSDVLLVPNAVLRWKPEASQVDPAATEVIAQLSNPKQGTAATNAGQEQGCLWAMADGGLVRPIAVTVGVTDGSMTEISGAGVKEGMRVVIGEDNGEDDAAEADGESASDSDKTSNPFLPKPPKGSRPPPGPPM
jgi:HlyD family secretion protein